MSSDVVTAREELYELAEALRLADTAEKEWKAKKEKVRKPFFELITEVVEDEIPLAKITEMLFDVDEDGVERWRLANYPEYLVLSIEKRDDSIVVALEEDAALRKFSFVLDGFKYGRTYSMTGGGTDVAGLYNALGPADISNEARLALLGAITPKQTVTYELDEQAVRDALIEHPELVTFVQKFIDPGTPQVKLTPITKAKDEE